MERGRPRHWVVSSVARAWDRRRQLPRGLTWYLAAQLVRRFYEPLGIWTYSRGSVVSRWRNGADVDDLVHWLEWELDLSTSGTSVPSEA